MWQPSYVPMFEDRRTRKGFVEKVMGLVLLQLLVTVGASALFRYWEPLLVSHNSALLTQRAFCYGVASTILCITGDALSGLLTCCARFDMFCEQSAHVLHVGEALHIVPARVMHHRRQ